MNMKINVNQPWMRGALNWFLPIFSPSILVWRNISNFVANGRHFNGSLHPVFPVNKDQNKAVIN